MKYNHEISHSKKLTFMFRLIQLTLKFTAALNIIYDVEYGNIAFI